MNFVYLIYLIFSHFIPQKCLMDHTYSASCKVSFKICLKILILLGTSFPLTKRDPQPLAPCHPPLQPQCIQCITVLPPGEGLQLI